MYRRGLHLVSIWVLAVFRFLSMMSLGIFCVLAWLISRLLDGLLAPYVCFTVFIFLICIMQNNSIRYVLCAFAAGLFSLVFLYEYV